MKIFFDTEFTGLRKDTNLISIGLISEDGRTFYAELSDFNGCNCDDWIRRNVVSNLHIMKIKQGTDEYIPNYHYGDKEDIKFALCNWFQQFSIVELVSDVCHYDMVLLIDLFGDAFSLPKNVCPSCYDINQDIARYYKISLTEAFDKSREEILYKKYKENEISSDKHNALYDAKVIREIYQIVNNVTF